ncbi:MAG: hypothetical protein B9S29_00730 [Opitutia bacterium Tous-C2FEB]|jgi:hypothetical protein|nr:MAG: hypothetical protein B9S29_00730 [Opitutae bacterium Tous-C2FEB]PAZ02422.1 MAG: hypothetical protein CAK89_06225 [Opitutae bacterium AMD-G3]
MKTLLCFCGLAAILRAAPAKDPYPVSVPAIAVTHPATDAPGFTALFNGKDLAGWRTKGNWVYATDGSITLQPRAGETGWKRFDAYLFTERKYRDFVLDLEFKIEPTGNSGVFFAVADPLNPVEKGIELQVLDTHGLATPGNHDCGGIIKAMGPAKNMVKPAGEWNRYTLTLKERLLHVDFNGQRIIVLKLDASTMKDRPAEGHVGFQDEAKRVWYRGVRLRELQ